MRRILLTLTAASFLATAALAPPDAAASWVWPVTGKVITPYRNGTDPYATGQHRGIDIAAPVGAAVRAAASGEVRFAGTAGSSGLTISIRTSEGYDTSYLHLSSIAIRAGTHVSAGERIGAVGTTGMRSATAPHLHFGVRDAGTRHAYHDPLAFLPPQAGPAPRPNPPAPAPAPAPEPRAPAAAPNPAPAPQGAPAPAPRRTPTPVPRRTPAPAPRGRPAPVPRPVPAPDPRGRRAPAPRLAPAPLGSPAPAPSPLPEQAPSGAPSPHGRAPGTGKHSGDAPSASTRSAVHLGEFATTGSHPIAASQPAATARRPRTERDARPGPDIGWALACAGLLLAAAILGVTGDRGREPSRGRARLAGALRPLLGRR
jgi:Peptidase family M23